MHEIVRDRPVCEERQEHGTADRSDPQATGCENEKCDCQQERCRQRHRTAPLSNCEQIPSEKVERWKICVSHNRLSEHQTQQCPEIVNAGNICVTTKISALFNVDSLQRSPNTENNATEPQSMLPNSSIGSAIL